MARLFMKGNEAIAEAAVLAGCRFFAGYPITPQNEIPEYLSRRMPQVGGVFVQGESEIASINMVFGAAAAGVRSLTSSSSPGISLKTEGISYLAGARLPAVIINVMRGGPGLGSIFPAQSDYFQVTRAMGHGGFRTIVLAPSTVQEAVVLTQKAFELSDRDRNPVVLALDGCLGALMEAVEFPEMTELSRLPDKTDWQLGVTGDRERRLIKSVFEEAEDQEQFNIEQARLYKTWQSDLMVEEYQVEDAEYVYAAYGICARIARTAVDELRRQGHKVGLVRPVTLYPFPEYSFARLDPGQVKGILIAEMTIPSQMIDDVRLGVSRDIPLATFGRSGGVVMQEEELTEAMLRMIQEKNRA